MGCSGCGSSGIIYGSVSAHKRSLNKPKVKGTASNGVVKSAKRLLREKESNTSAEIAEANKEAAASTE